MGQVTNRTEWTSAGTRLHDRLIAAFNVQENSRSAGQQRGEEERAPAVGPGSWKHGDFARYQVHVVDMVLAGAGHADRTSLAQRVVDGERSSSGAEHGGARVTERFAPDAKESSGNIQAGCLRRLADADSGADHGVQMSADALFPLRSEPRGDG